MIEAKYTAWDSGAVTEVQQGRQGKTLSAASRKVLDGGACSPHKREALSREKSKHLLGVPENMVNVKQF